jgi:phospholipid-transporting ATPase
MHGRWEADPDAGHIREFFRLLAVCHTVIPEGPPTPTQIRYQVALGSGGAGRRTRVRMLASRDRLSMRVGCMHSQAGSPDEAALVVAAKVFGFFFHARTLRGVKASHGQDDNLTPCHDHRPWATLKDISWLVKGISWPHNR